MPALTMSVARISAGLAASAFFASTAFAATLVVNGESPLHIAGNPGFTYLVNGGSGSLNVATEGFLFCTNIVTLGSPPDSAVTVVPQHGSWRLPIANDVLGVSYNSSELRVNPTRTSLVCHTSGPEGEVSTSLSDGIFRNAYEPKVSEQFSNQINWLAPAGFWSSPTWSAVPVDPCASTAQQPAAVDEAVTCAAISGQRAAGAGATMRAPTLWTGTDGSNFFYVARVDARYGPPNGQPAATAPMLAGNAPSGAGSVLLTVVDAYDSGVVGVGGGYLGDSGSWCILGQFPTTFTSTMCNGLPTSGTLNGPLGSQDFGGFVVGPPPIFLTDVSFYIAFVRPIIGAPPSIHEPAVAVSVMLEPSVTSEGGDAFKGDDVVFGFLPASTGFPWMTGQ